MAPALTHLELILSDPSVDTAGRHACESLVEAGECRSVRYFATVDSTNSAAIADLSAGGIHAELLPRLYLADEQTAGRGRLGRTWYSDGGTLTFSLVPPVGDSSDDWLSPESLPLAALATGVAVARTIEYLAAPAATRIKWPNDVYVAGGKAAGILVESVAARPALPVIGVGLNVATAWDRRGDTFLSAAMSLAGSVGGPRGRYEWLPELIAQLRLAFEQLAEDPESILSEVRSRCLLTGARVRYRQAGTVMQAECLGISSCGGLMVRHGGETRVIRSGEVHEMRRLL